jgi:hypothetical protein
METMRPRPRKPVTTPATRAPRAHVRAQVGCRVVVSGMGEAANGQVVKLGPGGMLVATPQVLPADIECDLCLLFGGDPPDTWLKGWVVYADGTGLAIQFDTLTPEVRRAIQQVMARFLETA